MDLDLNDYEHRCRECYQEYGSHHEQCLELSKHKLKNLLVRILSEDSEWLIYDAGISIEKYQR